MSITPGPVDMDFTAPLGVMVKGDLWSCIEIPDSVELFGTGKSVRVEATVDGEPVTAGLLPTGSGAHMLSVSAALRKKIGKDLGDSVTVHLSKRLT